MSDITVVITSISARLDDFFLRALESVVTQTRKPDAIVIAIDHDLTSRVINNEVLIGYGISDASKLVTISTPNLVCLN